jgi:hypothetical protein
VNQSRKLKILTLLTQALIIIGAGHGVAPLLIFEILGIATPLSEDFIDDKIKQAMFLYSILTFVGQILIICSIYSQVVSSKKKLQIVGLSLLSISTIYICLISYFDPNTVVLYVTCLPFLICVVIGLFGRSFSKFYRRLI